MNETANIPRPAAWVWVKAVELGRKNREAILACCYIRTALRAQGLSGFWNRFGWKRNSNFTFDFSGNMGAFPARGRKPGFPLPG
jgi:hypothetical protein